MEQGTSRTAAIIQARMGSSRLPGKSMYLIAGLPVLGHVLRRVQHAHTLNGVYVATSAAPKDDPIAAFCEASGIGVFRGSEDDVLERMYLASKQFGIDTVVRITADSPLVGSDVIDFIVKEHRAHGADFTTNFHSKSFPGGAVLSVIGVEVLEYLRNFEDPAIREHIVIDLDAIRRRFEVCIVTAPARWRRYDLRYCIDYEEDLHLVTRLLEHFSEQGGEPATEDIIRYLDAHQDVKAMNAAYARQGY